MKPRLFLPCAGGVEALLLAEVQAITKLPTRSLSKPLIAWLIEREATSLTASAWAAIRSPVRMVQTSCSVFGSHMMWRFCTAVDSMIRFPNRTCGDMC